ncbi:molybdopterin-dependent oxidoreductase [Actinomadura sp. 1N219]|uniref:molybdopterin-dependent oxidoreductase n=1 Tax=Actinomadura sp. 1N219 TaxID=3375152 RepID=UPI0037A5A020
MPADQPFRSHSSHWGPYQARIGDTGLEVRPDPGDLDPSALLGNIAGSVHHSTRVTRPMVRTGWLEHGPGPARRGDGGFTPVSWDDAFDLLSAELRRVTAEHGNHAIFGGSYGWSSAGRFHHAQSQVHRFLNCIGGYVRSVGTYSAGTAETFFPHVVAPAEEIARLWHTWEAITGNAELVLAFGGMPLKNTFVASGGIAEHRVRSALDELHRNGGQVVNISPLRDDYPPEFAATWVPLRPFGDVPLMLAMCHVLVTEGLHDQEFLDRCTVGFEEFAGYLLGRDGEPPKSPEWASPLCGVPAEQITALARRAAGARTLVNVTHSLQRAQHGEQPLWAALSLACLLGDIGRPGLGLAYSLGSMGNNGSPPMSVPIPAVPQGHNAVDEFIPVARIADMLLNPGQPYDFNGQRRDYPDIRLVYWAGGNPFHHHQDLFRLREAFGRPDTIVVHEQYWTSMARHADIVLPATLSLERHDIGAGRHDRRLMAMHQVLEPHGEARDDYAVFSGLAERLGVLDAFTEGRSAAEWVETLYREFADALRQAGHDAPSYEEFWQQGGATIPPQQRDELPMQAFRRDPDAFPLRTPSGRIEIHSATIASFGYADCGGHPRWLEPSERVTDEQLEQGFLQLVANNPATRLHGQLDVGATSQNGKVSGREPARLNPADAARRGIRDGDVVRIHNERGACLAGAALSDDVVPGVVQLSTGAWFDPITIDGVNTCVHGNPNAVTIDAGTSSLTQGCSGQLARVQVERFDGEAPEVTVTTSTPEPARPQA